MLAKTDAELGIDTAFTRPGNNNDDSNDDNNDDNNDRTPLRAFLYIFTIAYS